jgi:septal ring factor EnvC (AmiA/AmiB activator)
MTMTTFFIALGIAIITLLFILLWYVPHLFQQQAGRSAREAAQLRDMLLDMLNEQEAVMQRQAQLSTAITNLQQQLAQLMTASKNHAAASEVDVQSIRQLEERITALHQQLQRWIEHRGQQQRHRDVAENESWANLLSLLAAIQERLAQLSVERINVSVGLQARTLLEELEQEMAQLRSISEDIATLQWRLRRSLHERETNVAQLRARSASSSSTVRPV